MFTISTDNVVIARVAGALYGYQLGNASMASVLASTSVMGVNSVLNSVVGRDALYNNWTPAAIANQMVSKLGITTAPQITEATAFITGRLAAVPSSQYGQTIAEILGLFSGLTNNAFYGTFATNYNNAVAAAVTRSQTAEAADVASFSPVPAGGTFVLTTAVATLTGTGFADFFEARIFDNANSLQSNDVINGGGGVDTLNADIGLSQSFAITPETTSVENVNIRAQAAAPDSGNGNNIVATKATIDAQRMSGVAKWASDNSRSDVIIEDVRINSNVTTVEWKESDPGNVDFGVYFNQRNLVNTSGGSSSLNIYIMDTVSAVATPTEPLKYINMGGYTFYSTTNGVKQLVVLKDPLFATATDYTKLQAAFVSALKTASVGGTINPITQVVTGGVTQNLSGDVAVTLSADVNLTAATAADPLSAPSSGSFLNLTGKVLTLTLNSTGTVVSSTAGETGWLSGGIAPGVGAVAQALNTGSSSSIALVNTDIILDDVGMGSTGGDLVVGGMSVGDTSTSMGVERFNIEVRDNSKLQTINSTNNTLREVVIKNGLTTSTSTAYVTTTKDAGDLTVNGVVGDATGFNAPLPGTATTYTAGVAGSAVIGHNAAGAAGFVDVRLIDGSAMTGKLAFTAAITSDTIGKYINAVDVAAALPGADIATNNVKGLGANFDYRGGTNNDTITVTIDGNTAGSRSNVVAGKSDFTFSVEGGAGNDAITVTVVGGTDMGGGLQNWANNQDLNNNITISGGAGNDTIRTPGAGDTRIDAGAGIDRVYTDNTGRQTVTIGAGAVGGAVTASNAMWVLNTSDQVSADPFLTASRNVADIRSGDNKSMTLYAATLVVSFKGLPSASITVPSSATFQTTDLDINQAIKKAINDDATLSALLIARDGPGNTLIVTSLIDGVMSAADLTVTLTAPTLTAAQILVAGSPSQATVDASVATFNTNAEYIDVMGTDGTRELVGAASTSSSDNFVTPGSDSDVIVLGTTVGVDVARSSNETVVYAAGFGDDVIVNFAASGNGIDHLNFASLGGTTLAGAMSQAAGQIAVVVAVPATNGTAALLQTAYRLLDVVGAASRQVVVVYDAQNVGRVYSIANGAAANDAIVTLEGSIDLADTGWASLTQANFTAPSAFAEGASTAVVNTISATFNNQVLLGTANIDFLSAGGFTGVTMTGLASGDTFIVPTLSTGTVITDLATGDSVTTAGTATVTAGATAATGVAAFVATASTVNSGTTFTINSLTAGSTVNVSAATGTSGFTLVGDAGVDNLTGSANADSIFSGAGADVIAAGAGADTVVIDGLGTKSVSLGAGNDTLQVNALASIVNVSDLASGDIVTVGATASVVATNITQFIATAGTTNASTNLLVTLTTAAAGGTINMAVAGGAGGYGLNGGAGADTLVGSNANADIISGGAGIDTMTGGTAAVVDVFAFGTAGSLVGSMDIITDYRAAATADQLTFGAAVTVLAAADATPLVAGSGVGANVNNTAGGYVTFAVADNTLALKIAAVQADVQLDAINTVAIFSDGTNTYVYYAGAAIGNADDQIIQLTGFVTTAASVVTPGAATTIAP